MIDALYSMDRWLLLLLNRTLASPITDALWPFITDYDKQWPVRILLVLVWIVLLVRGGARGRTAALLLIPLLFITDQVNSHVLKDLFQRLRPCHVVDGVPVVPDVRLLVGCGSGFSFPSSHAVNNFGVATLLAVYYRKAAPWLLGWAALVALSRSAVGVHYPSDGVAGAAVGLALGYFVVRGWTALQRKYLTRWGVHEEEGTAQ